MIHHSEHFVIFWKPIIGYLTGIAAYTSATLAEVQTLVPTSWWEGGSLAVLVGSLSFATVTLWKSNLRLQGEIKEELRHRVDELKDMIARKKDQ